MFQWMAPNHHVNMGSTKCVQCLIKKIRKEENAKPGKVCEGYLGEADGEAVIGSKYNVCGHKTPKE